MFKLLKYDDFLEYDEVNGTYYMASDQAVRDETEKFKWKNAGFTFLKDWRLYVMLIPMIFVYIFWKYMPLYELVAVFKQGEEVEALDRAWTGLENFKTIFGLGVYKGSLYSTQFWMAFRNTFILSFYGLLFGFPFPIILALFFNEIRSNVLRSILQVCVYLPKFLSTVVVTSLLLAMFRGSNIANGQQVGIVSRFMLLFSSSSDSLLYTEAQSGLLYSTAYFRALYEISNAWESAGYGSIVYFAAVIAISPTSYEAAQIDGAGKMQQMRFVVIPNILSTVVIMLIMKIGSLLSVGYEKLYLLCPNTEYNNYSVATVVSTWANYWSSGEGTSKTTAAYGMAGEMTNNLIGMILVIGANTVAKKAANVSLY
ncbi:MAG: ABC transporter permease subunit [Clostridia bacterium]|nr:ABC transporter permease subunit [Clostridia bacterium]